MYFQYLSDKQASIPFIINFNVFVLHATLVSVKKRYRFCFSLDIHLFPYNHHSYTVTLEVFSF